MNKLVTEQYDYFFLSLLSKVFPPLFIHKQTLEKSKKRQLKLTKLPKRKCQSNNECTNVFLVCVHLQADSQAHDILVFLAVNLEKKSSSSVCILEKKYLFIDNNINSR